MPRCTATALSTSKRCKHQVAQGQTRCTQHSKRMRGGYTAVILELQDKERIAKDLSVDPYLISNIFTFISILYRKARELNIMDDDGFVHLEDLMDIHKSPSLKMKKELLKAPHRAALNLLLQEEFDTTKLGNIYVKVNSFDEIVFKQKEKSQVQNQRHNRLFRLK